MMSGNRIIADSYTDYGCRINKYPLVLILFTLAFLLAATAPAHAQETTGEGGDSAFEGQAGTDAADEESVFQDAAGADGETSASSDDEDLFGAEEEVQEADSTDTTAIRDVFLETEGVTLTGSFTGTLGMTFTWNDPWNGSFDPVNPATRVMNPAAGAALGFSAKPFTDLSVYGEARTAYPFVKTVSTYDPAGKVIGSTTVPDISIFKLYSRFSWNDAIFFSFGKQPLKWGQGFFFTPANDLLSVSAVDFDNPEAEREGPLSFRMNAPIPGTLSNAYLFAVMKSASMDPTEIAVAPKFEMSFPGFDVYAAGYYQKDDKTRLIAGGNWVRDELSLFGEGVISFGSKQQFIVKEDRTVTIPGATVPGLGTLPASQKTFHYRIAERPDEAVFTGTVGGMYRKTWEKTLELSVVAQYLFDGQGQDNLTLFDAADSLTERLNPYHPEKLDPAEIADPAKMMSLLSKFGSRLGRHYGVVSVSAGNLFDSDVSLSVFALANLYDFSGWVKPQVTWKIFDRMSVSFWTGISFGSEGDEYTNMGGIYKALRGLTVVNNAFAFNRDFLVPVLQAGINFTLGSGSF